MICFETKLVFLSLLPSLFISAIQKYYIQEKEFNLT